MLTKSISFRKPILSTGSTNSKSAKINRSKSLVLDLLKTPQFLDPKKQRVKFDRYRASLQHGRFLR